MKKNAERSCPVHSNREPALRLVKGALGQVDGAITPRGWPGLGNLPGLMWQLLLARGDFIGAIRRMLARHGTKTLLLRIGSRRLALTVDPKVAHRILVEESTEFPKTDWEERVLKPVMEGGLIILDGPEWKAHRQALASCFGPQKIQELAEMTRQATRNRLDLWNGSVNVSHEMRCIVNDVMFRFFLADHRLEDVDAAARSFEQVERGLEDRVFDPLFFSERLKRVLGVGRRFRAALASVTEKILTLSRARASRGPDDGSTALDVLLGKLPSLASVTQEVRTTMGAGATTGHLLTWICRLLADHPDVQDKVRREIREIAGPGDSLPSLTQMEAMPWLTAVIQEGLRLYPPAPFLIRQTEDTVPDMVFVSVWAMHRDPDYWERPDEFVPERWIGSQSVPDAFVPFGMGPRVCVGKRFALIESRVVLLELLRRFRLERPQDALPRAKFTVLTRPENDVVLRLVNPIEE